MFANTQMMGLDLGFPDVCLTPTPAPVPIPYPNLALGPMTVPAVYNVILAPLILAPITKLIGERGGGRPGWEP